MSYIKHIVLLAMLLPACTQIPKQQPADYKPDISLSDVVNFKQAITSLENNDFKKAELILKKLTDENPEISGPWANLGLIYFKNTQYTKSLYAVNMALRLNPANPYALNLSAMLASKDGDINRARTLYARALEVKQDYAIAFYNLALLYDVYYQDVNTASKYYRHYLKLINGDDKQTVDWLEQMLSSMKKS